MLEKIEIINCTHIHKCISMSNSCNMIGNITLKRIDVTQCSVDCSGTLFLEMISETVPSPV